MLVVVIGMILNNYSIREELMVPLEQYERDNNISPIILVENLLEEFLYKKGYIKVEEEVIKTPEEIKNERKNKFKIKKSRKNYKIFFENIYFGMFHENEVEYVINGLLNFSDDELKEFDMKTWKTIYPVKYHKPFLLKKLENQSLTPEDFLKKDKIKIWKRRNDCELRFNNSLICMFNKDKFSQEIIDKVYSFLNNLSDDVLLNLINERKNSKLTSAEFIFEYMEKYSNNDLPKKKHTSIRNGKYHIKKDRNGTLYSFGTHDKENIDEVLNFLKNNNWNTKYSTNKKKKGFYGKAYINWLYSEIEKFKRMGC